MAAPRRNQAPGKPITGLVMLGAAAAAGYAIYQGYPGIAAVWAGLLVSAWTYPPAMFTGKKDSRGYPSPAHPGEQSAMNKYRLWEDLKFKLALPNMDWLPGLKPRLSFLAAVWAGAAAYLIPVTDVTYTAGYGPWIDAAAAFIAVAQYAASRRRTQVPDDECPGARVDSLIALARKNLGQVIGLFIGGIVVGGIVGTVATVLLPIATTAAQVPAIPEPAIWALCLTGGPHALLSKAWITEALEHWRIVVAAREEWKGRWEMLKQDPAPRLIDRQEVGAAIIDTFDAPGATGSAPYFVMAEKINPTLGTGAKFAVLDVPNLDSDNQPVPGTKHPLRFEIVRWPSDQMPDITDPETPKEVVYQLVRCAIAWAADGTYSRPVLDDVHLLTVPPAPAGEPSEGNDEAAAPATGRSVWAISWFLPDGPPAVYIRKNGRAEMSEALQALVLVDHRAQGGNGCAYAGALLEPDTTWDPGCGLSTKDMKKLADEDTWNQRWAEAAPKHKENPPVMEAATANTARLKNGVNVNTIAFVTRQGMTPHDFFVFESALPSTLNAAPFVAMTDFPGSGKRQGERHPQAFSVYWSSEAVPGKPDDLAPVPRSEAPRWVLAGLLNQAFKAARLADRPEIAAATCLTKPESRQHIWKIDLRLYGGVTLAQVRTAAQTIRQHWASEWLRVAAAPDGCTIIVGARPSKVQLASPRHEQYLASLDWEQAFLDSGVSGTGGLLPTLTSVGTLPNNEKVTVTDFILPAGGIDYTMVRAATEKLKSATDNIFMDVQRTASASSIRILSCPENPMPERVAFDFDAVDASGHLIPFATGIEGEPIMFDPITSPHALLAGVTRSDKSVLAQGFVYGMLVKGALVFIIDPMKAAADFKFSKDYAAGFAVDLYEAAATLKAVYAIVVERRKINSAMGVGSYHELADPPPPLVVLIDEFTSLMQKENVPPVSDDPEEEVLREEIISINRAKQEIGTFTGKLAREAASAGVNLLLGTQKLSAKLLETLPGGSDLKTNLARTLLGQASSGDRMSALRDFDAAPSVGNPIPKGRGLWEPLDHSAVVIQTWFATQDQFTSALAERLPVLAAGDRINIAPYLRRPQAGDEALPGSAPAPAAGTAPARADQVVDLGELELDLDDLDWSDMDLTEEEHAAAAPAPENESEEAVTAVADADLEWPEDETAPEVDNESVMLLDVDGVIAPFTLWDGLDHIAAPGHGTVMFDPAILTRMAAVPVSQAWLTSWEDDAPDNFGHLFPRATEVLIADTENTGWWKIDAALDWIRENPQIRRLVWIDDELNTKDPVLGLTYRDIAEDAFEAAGVDALLVVPDADRGVTAAELDGIEAFFGTGTAGAPVVVAAPADELVEELALEPAATTVEPDELDWEAIESDIAVPARSRGPEVEDPFATPAAVAMDLLEDPFAEPAPKKRFVPDDDDPFA